MNQIQRVVLSALVVVVTGIILLLVRAPETPHKWWGWLLAFLVPIPSAISLANFKPEGPKLPLLTTSHFRKRQQLAIGGFKLALAGHIMFTVLAWLIAGNWLYVRPPL